MRQPPEHKSPQLLDAVECCQLLRELVEIESYSGEEHAASEFLVSRMLELGYDRARVDAAGSAVGIRGSLDECRHTIVLLGHIDTVGGLIPVRIQDGILHGRGSVDAKGPLAAFTLAGAMAHLPPEIGLIVAGAVEEESATSKGARQIAADFRADYCIIGEPSGTDAITLGYKGRLLIDYQVSINEGHSAGPGQSAAEAAAAFWQQLQNHCREFNADRDKLFDKLLPSLRNINSQSDGLIGRAVARLGVRLPPEFDIDGFRDFLQKAAVDGSVEMFGYERAHQANRQNKLVRCLATAIQTQGFTTRYKHKTGTSDMNVVAPTWGCPIVAYGAGDSNLDHTPHEHLHLDEFLQSVNILKVALELLGQQLVKTAV